jgi:hypothetical protein
VRLRQGVVGLAVLNVPALVRRGAEMAVIAAARIFAAFEPVHKPPALLSLYIKNVFARVIIPFFEKDSDY